MTEIGYIDYEVVVCCVCGISFKIPQSRLSQMKRNHETFYCPNGHPQWFPGESREEILKKELEKANASLSRLEAENTILKKGTRSKK